jgi:hypothetical protein
VSQVNFEEYVASQWNGILGGGPTLDFIIREGSFETSVCGLVWVLN